MTLIRSRAVLPVDIAGAALDRIALLNDQLLAFCVVDAELVLDQARRGERDFTPEEDDIVVERLRAAGGWT